MRVKFAKAELMSIGGSWDALAEYEGGGEPPSDAVCSSPCLTVIRAFFPSIGSGIVEGVLSMIMIDLALLTCNSLCAAVDSFLIYEQH